MSSVVKRIHQRFEIAREIDRVGWRGRHEEGHLRPEAQEVAVDLRRPALDEPRQDEAPLQGRDRRLQDARRLEGGIVARRPVSSNSASSASPSGTMRGRSTARAAALGEERGERAGGAPRRNVDGHVGERRRIGGEGSDKAAVEKRVDEGRQERAARRDREDARFAHVDDLSARSRPGSPPLLRSQPARRHGAIARRGARRRGDRPAMARS